MIEKWTESTSNWNANEVESQMNLTKAKNQIEIAFWTMIIRWFVFYTFALIAYRLTSVVVFAI